MMRSPIATRRSIVLGLVLGLTALHAARPFVLNAEAGPSTRRITITKCQLRAVDEVQLASQRSGILAEVAKPGGFVASGNTVARLRDAVARAGLAIADKEASNDIEVRFARKAAQLAQLKYERSLEANQVVGGTVSTLELRELRLAAEKALLQLEQAEHQFQVANLRQQEQQANLRTLHITAPFDAFVRLVHKKPGEVVREGEVILEIINTGRIRVEGYIEVGDVPYVLPGSPVHVTPSGDRADGRSQNRTFVGRIGFVDVKVEPVERKVRVWAEVTNHNQLLRDGLTATMTINPDL